MLESTERMDTMNPCDKKPSHTLPTLDSKPYLAIAFDGCFYYLTMPNDKTIYKYDNNFTQKGEFQSNKSYNGLCYDSLEDCFWATETTQPNKIFKLNSKLKEIDYIPFKNTRCDYKRMMGISYDCARNMLLAAFNDEIWEISKTGEAKPVVKNLCPHVLNVLSISPYIAVAINAGEKQNILFFKNDKLIKSESVPLEYRIRDITYNPCKPALLILATKHCQYPRILCYSLNVDIDCCHKILCDKKCKPSPQPDDKCNIIKSVALMETALSHILNAEGEKLQKAVEVADSVEELLEMNKSIHKTLLLASQLENILLAKLQVATDLEC